ncbi:G5 domain-containing protein [Streptococcus merionis]|uniref:LPXTG cell wall surface protein n=1 Tax=Streptococcus merionis TaxID=400065 RepID=A0A239SU07_9STRE|nr:G5 domain-containing protein [Streptococcus merionis]SNU88910.1 LPXTG cell wall surface protein [Streptococcus merionis]
MKSQRDLRYSIRKLKCGVGSIAVAMVVFSANSTALATTMEQPSASEVVMSSSDKMEADSTLSDEVAVKEELSPTSEIIPVEEPTTTENQEPKEADLPKEPETVTLTQEPAEPLPVAEARSAGREKTDKELREESQKLFLQYLYQRVQELRDVDYEQYGTTKNLDSSKNLDNVFASSNKDNTDLSVAMAGYVDSIVKARGQESEGKKNFSDYIQKDYREASSKGLKELEEKINGHSSASEELKKTYIHRIGKVTSLVELYKTIPEEFEREVEKQKLEKDKKETVPSEKDQPQGDAPANPDQEQPQGDDSGSSDKEEQPQKEKPADQDKIAEYKKLFEQAKELAEVDGSYKNALGDSPGTSLEETLDKSGVTDMELAEAFLSFINYANGHKENNGSQLTDVEKAKQKLSTDYQTELQKAIKAETDKINKSSASEGLKKKYNELLKKETKLTRAYKEIPGQFDKALVQEQKAELQKEIEKATQKVYQTAYLKNKDSYVSQLEKVSSKDEITNILKQVEEAAKKDKADFEAAEKVRKEIKDFKYLTQEQKNGYSTELEEKTKEEAAKILERAKNENLQGLIQAGQGLIKELQSELAEVEKLPKAPDTDDYNEQHGLWEYFSKLGKDQINNFKQFAVKPSLDIFAKIEKTYKDLIDFGYQLRIEDYTRQVAEYRKKYSGHLKIEELFKKHIKQTPSTNYGSQFGHDLRFYFEQELTPAFQKIQQLVNNLDKKAEGAQKLEKLIAEYAEKPKARELMKALEEREALIKVANEEIGGFDKLIDKYVKDAEDAVATYNKEYQMYLEVLKKGQEAMRSDIGRLRALKNEKATELANELEREVTYLATAELSGDFDYKTFIPENVAKVKKQVDDFIAEYERTHRPLTPLEPAIVETTEIQKEAIDYLKQEIPANDLEKGKRRVKVVGQKGEKEITYKVRKRGDQVLSRDKVNEKITKEAVTEVIEVGTKEVKPSQPKPHTPEIKTQKKREVEIPFETKQVENKDLPKGQTRVKQEGKVGIRTIVEEITTKDGKVVSRKTIIDEVTTQPIARIIEVGTKVETPLEIVESEETETQDIAYETKEVSNPNLPKGQRKVTTPGQKGQKTITYKVKKQGDKVISREKISEQVIKAPVTEVVEVGTKEVKPVPSKPETKTQQEKNEMGTKEPEKMAPEMAQKSQKQVSSGTQKGSSDKTPKKQLPNTGEATSVFVALGSVLLILVVSLIIQKKKKSEK